MSTPSQITLENSSTRRLVVWILLTLLILAATSELGIRGFHRALFDMQDFAVIYASTRAFETGKNPYEAADMRAAWLEASRSRPADPAPQDLALYPPSTYLLLSPLGLIDWSHVRWVWLLINLIALAVLIVMLTRYWPAKLSSWKIALSAAFVLGFGPIHTAIAKGQLAVLVTALLALAMVAESHHAVIRSVMLIAIAAALKPQIAAPIILLYLLQRRWKAIAIVAGLDLALVGVASLRLYLAGTSWIDSLLRNVRLAAAPGGVYDPSPTNPLAFQLINASALFHRLINNPAVDALLLVVIGLSVAFFLWKRGSDGVDLSSDPYAFAAACVLGLVLISHRYYDAIVLVFVFAWALSELSGSGRISARITIAGCLLMAFPLPALLISSGHGQAPPAVPQPFWDVFVIQQQSWIILIIMAALTAAFFVSRNITRTDFRVSAQRCRSTVPAANCSDATVGKSSPPLACVQFRKAAAARSRYWLQLITG